MYLHHLNAGLTVTSCARGGTYIRSPKQLHAGQPERRRILDKHQAGSNEQSATLRPAWTWTLTENVFGWPAVVSHQRSGNSAQSAKPANQGQKWNERRICHHAGGQGQVFHVRSGEMRIARMEGRSDVRSAALPSGERGAMHALHHRDAPSPGGTGQVFGTGCHQFSGPPRQQITQKDRVSVILSYGGITLYLCVIKASHYESKIFKVQSDKLSSSSSKYVLVSSFVWAGFSTPPF